MGNDERTTLLIDNISFATSGGYCLFAFGHAYHRQTLMVNCNSSGLCNSTPNGGVPRGAVMDMLATLESEEHQRHCGGLRRKQNGD